MLTKTYFLSRHGCAKNQVDAELLVGNLEAIGWDLIDDAKTASVIIINSCGFIESAKKESLKAVFEARALNPNAKIILAGCLAERYASELKNELPEVDIFFGNGDISKITEVFASLFKDKEASVSGSMGADRVWIYPQIGVSCGARPKLFNYQASTYIKITEGCSNCCTFCAIPLIRGAVRSRAIEEICQEIKTFIEEGIYEFNLIGQDLAAFSAPYQEPVLSPKPTSGYSPIEQKKILSRKRSKVIDKFKESLQVNVDKNLSGLGNLLKAISSMEGDFVVRLLYIHPDNFPRDILPIMASDNRFLPYFDLPFQSASEPVLKMMNRRGNRVGYTQLLKDIQRAFEKSQYGGACIRTTFLVGFPGETNADFEETLLFLKTVRPMWSGAFDYSPEENTKAVSFPNQVPKRVALARKSLLQDQQAKITAQLLRDFIGKELQVLVEEIIENPNDENAFLIGRTWFQAPEVDGCVVVPIDEERLSDFKPGDRVMVRVLEVRSVDLEGVLV